MIVASLVWLAGMLTAVPYAAWYLWFHAPREQYALIIASVLFWIFGYWSVVGPVMVIVKVRSLWRRLESATSSDERRRLLLSPESKEIAVDIISAESGLPKFLARRVYERLSQRLSAAAGAR